MTKSQSPYQRIGGDKTSKCKHRLINIRHIQKVTVPYRIWEEIDSGKLVDEADYPTVFYTDVRCADCGEVFEELEA